MLAARQERTPEHPRLRRAEVWARDLIAAHGLPQPDGRVFVPLLQPEILQLMGCRPGSGLLSRYLNQLGDAVERVPRKGLIFDPRRLDDLATLRPRLRPLPTQTDTPEDRSAAKDTSEAAEHLHQAHRALITVLTRALRAHEDAARADQEVIAAQTRLIMLLSGQPGAATLPSDARGSRAEARARRASHEQAQASFDVDNNSAELGFYDDTAPKDDQLYPARDESRATARAADASHREAHASPDVDRNCAQLGFYDDTAPKDDQVSPARDESRGTVRATPSLDWDPEELASLVQPLADACQAVGLAGMVDAPGVLAALRAAGCDRATVQHGVHNIARRLRHGELIRSPFGLLVRAASQGWDQYFQPPTPEQQPTERRGGRGSAGRRHERDGGDASLRELRRRAESAVRALELCDDDELAELDERVRRAGVLASDPPDGSWPSDAPVGVEDRHALRVWAFMQREQEFRGDVARSTTQRRHSDEPT